jgi:hypothetical protein
MEEPQRPKDRRPAPDKILARTVMVRTIYKRTLYQMLWQELLSCELMFVFIYGRKYSYPNSTICQHSHHVCDEPVQYSSVLKLSVRENNVHVFGNILFPMLTAELPHIMQRDV